MLRARDAGIHKPEDIAASFQQAVVDSLANWDFVGENLKKAK